MDKSKNTVKTKKTFRQWLDTESVAGIICSVPLRETICSTSRCVLPVITP